MATFDDIARLQKNISCPGGLRPRASLYVSAPTKRKILEVLKIGGERLTATSYVDNILRHHLEMFRDEINCIHQEQNYHNIV